MNEPGSAVSDAGRNDSESDHEGGRNTGTGLLWISPWIVGFACFTMLPLALGVWYSMTDWTLLEAPIPVGDRELRATAR